MFGIAMCPQDEACDVPDLLRRAGTQGGIVKWGASKRINDGEINVLTILVHQLAKCAIATKTGARMKDCVLVKTGARMKLQG